MKPEQYTELASRTMANPITTNVDKRLNDSRSLNLLHAGMGMVTESAEFLDALKKHLFYGNPLDIPNLKEELGDQLFYISMALIELGVDYSNVMSTNIAKLEKRYPDGFSQEKATNRDLDSEREILENESNEAVDVRR